MIAAMIVCLLSPCVSAAEMAITFQQESGRLEILAGGQPFAKYVYEDDEILRPYFCDVKAPNGIQVTRTNPPDPEIDKNNDDHATFHPGIWLAFGDIGGEDFWRNKARVRHVRFEHAPEGGTTGKFTVVNAYETADDTPKMLCEEICEYTITATAEERWITARSQFRAKEAGIAFGDQEEMGLGVRMATPLTVKHGSGTIHNSTGGINEEGTWGKQADWCAYSGVIDEKCVGIMIMSSPVNFRPCWFHTRDYGLMVANPFGKKAMTAPKDKSVPDDATPLPKEEDFILEFAVCVFSTNTNIPPNYKELFSSFKNR
jgi:hypothetical protein